MEFSLQEQRELDVSLQEGSWVLHVGEYALYQEAIDGNYYFVESEFTSTNPQEIRIFSDATTRVQLNFMVNDEEVVTDGHLAFDISIDDGGQSDTSDDVTANFWIPSGGRCDPCTHACELNAARVCASAGSTIDIVYTREPGTPGLFLTPTQVVKGACNVHCK